MKEALLQLGLSEKEAKCYLFLLSEGVLAAAEIAKGIQESRTNTYMILERLAAEGLAEPSDATAVRKYRAADPLVLRKLVALQQQQLKQTQAAVAAAIPQLSSMFSLSQHRPGVLYLEGIDGLKALLEDNAKVRQGTIDLIASDEAYDNQEAWALLQKGAQKRKARGINTRGLFHAPEYKWQKIKEWGVRGYEVRKWGKEELPGEIVIYGNKVAFVTYRPAIIVTIMTNEIMAQTFRVIFNQLWETAKT